LAAGDANCIGVRRIFPAIRPFIEPLVQPLERVPLFPTTPRPAPQQLFAVTSASGVRGAKELHGLGHYLRQFRQPDSAKPFHGLRNPVVLEKNWWSPPLQTSA